MDFKGFNDRIAQLRVHKTSFYLGHSLGCVCRILPGLFPKDYVPVLVNE